jgi:hypothetical protein
MNLLHIYRLALVEGLTAKQAGSKYNVNHCSLAKCKTRYNLPTLKNEWDAGYEDQLGKLNDTQLVSYYKALCIPKNSKSVRELNVCKLLLEKRKLCLK